MYCPNCGKEVDQDDRFCRYCSFDLGFPDGTGSNPGATVTGAPETRSTGLAMAMSLVLPGLGAYYVASDTRGLLVFVVSLILMVATFTVVPYLFIITGLVMFVLWILGIKMTSEAIDRYREDHPL
ncbi:MAG: zinc-ribbon domain-containing protein [Candidatus Methanomethylophilaceae archaeon]|nr:zinc-ribbon domain-containing protein [Candidatus Methanomethylophilaceae archaeon]